MQIFSENAQIFLMPIEITQEPCYPVVDCLYKRSGSGLSRNIVGSEPEVSTTAIVKGICDSSILRK